jgi:hypothetical protein
MRLGPGQSRPVFPVSLSGEEKKRISPHRQNSILGDTAISESRWSCGAFLEVNRLRHGDESSGTNSDKRGVRSYIHRGGVSKSTLARLWPRGSQGGSETMKQQARRAPGECKVPDSQARSKGKANRSALRGGKGRTQGPHGPRTGSKRDCSLKCARQGQSKQEEGETGSCDPIPR